VQNLNPDPAFWYGKRVFVTGHTGFKGGWLSLWLQQLGAIVTGYALDAPSEPNLFGVANVVQGMHSIIANIKDGETLKQAMQAAKPEIVLHLAAQSLVRYSYENPVETYATNVVGLVQVFEAIRATSGVRAVVNVTTDKCYDNKEWAWGYRENDTLGGYDPYSNSKACAELVTAAYRNSYFNAQNYATHGVALASARAGNVIGGGDWARDRLIPDILRAIEQGEPVQIRNPNAIRPWQHVLEPLSGYLRLAEKLYTDGMTYAEAWNFGPYEMDVKPVGWIVERIAQKWGPSAQWTLNKEPQPHEAHYLKLDCAKARSLLDWTSRWNIEQAIDKIVEWHKAREQGADMRQITLAQIGQYTNHSNA